MTDSTDTSSNGTKDISPIEGSLELAPTNTQTLFLDMAPLEALSKHEKVVIPRNPTFNRKEVVQSFQSAFELIGGVPRLALWANENPNEFYKLFGKLLPSSNSSALGEQSKLVIEMAIKPGALDEA